MDVILSVDSVGKTFGRRRVLTAASLRLRSGALCALVGQNGAGKSTLLRIAAGLVRADFGQICFLGRFVGRPQLASLARQGLCFLPARGLLMPDVAIGAQFSMIAAAFPVSVDDSSEVMSRVRAVWNRTPQSLSGGEQKLIDIAAALYRRPLCLLADEPLRGLAPKDAEHCLLLLRTLAAQGCAVAITGHETTNILSTVDEVVWCVGGTTHTLGSPQQAMARDSFRRGYLGLA